MARKWEINSSQYAWNFEECEELVLIAGYEEIKSSVPPSVTWPIEFENHFYQHGNGVAFRYVDEINAVRRRLVKPRLDYIETDVFEYGRSSIKLMKSEHRRRVRDELATASIEVRLRMVARALEDMKGLPPPHLTFEQYKANNRKFSDESDSSRKEAGRRLQALERSTIRISKPPPVLSLEQKVMALNFASGPDLRAKIIETMSPDEALGTLALVENADLRDALIRRGFSGYLD
jgi:hypothetical protein